MEYVFQCSYCPIKKATHDKLLKHLQLYHENEKNFSVTCGLDGCPRVFTRVKSLQNHLRHNHKSTGRNQSEIDEAPVTLTTVLETHPIDSEENSGVSISQFVETLTDTLQRQLALFSLKLQEKHAIQRCVQTEVISEVEALFNFFHLKYKDIFSKCIDNLNIDTRNPLFSFLNDSNFVEHCFSAVSTTHKLDRYCAEELNLIEPIEYALGVDSLGKRESFQYVPLLDILKLIVSDQSTLEHIFEKRATHGESVTDYSDGALYRNTIWSSEDHFLRIHLYNDEFEVVNPIGSRRLLHKVSAFYFTLGNIHPKYRSNLKHIHLLLLVKYNTLKKYGVKKIVEPLISDLKKLESNGIELVWKGKELSVRGALVTVSADNLSAHALAGFSCSFSSGRVCRYCLCHYKDLSLRTQEDECVLRTPETHNYHLQCVAEDPTTKSLYGVTGPCAFSELPNFSVTNAFPPDVMHDFLEGVVPHVLKLVLKALHNKKVVSVQEVSNAIAHFPFGQNDSSHKPRPISERLLSDGQIIGKAVEKWTLLRTIPLIIGNKISKGDKNWQLILCLKNIAEILLAPTISIHWISPLAQLITSFLTVFKNLFPDSITPKLHFLVHYPRLIEDFGPPRAHWCMRFEAKHRYFKKVSQVVCNFKNICSSLAKRNQLRQCWDWQGDKVPGRDECSVAVSRLDFNELDKPLQEKLMSYSQGLHEENIWSSKNILLNTVKYSLGNFVILDLLHEDIPQFVKITQLLNIRASWFIVGQLFSTLGFEAHLHSYCVTPSEDIVIFKAGEEIDFHSLDCYHLSDQHFISLIHRPFKPM